jgi:hypothetical protein
MKRTVLENCRELDGTVVRELGVPRWLTAQYLDNNRKRTYHQKDSKDCLCISSPLSFFYCLPE